MQRAAASDAQVLIITGAGKAFCDGIDLENLKALIGRSAQDSLRDSEALARLFGSVYDFPRPTIAAVNGAAIAGGRRPPRCATSLLASEESSFDILRCGLGLFPAIVSTFFDQANRREAGPRPPAYRSDHEPAGGPEIWL